MTWYDAYRSTTMTRAISSALKEKVDDPYKLLAIAVVGMAVSEHDSVDEIWIDLGCIDAGAMGVTVSAG